MKTFVVYLSSTSTDPREYFYIGHMNKDILIVEDELILVRGLRRMLERNGYKVMGISSTVEKALTVLAAHAPSLVLIDIFLKGEKTGIDLAAFLNTKGIPFIYISANSNRQVLEAAKTTDPYGFIVKPFREKDLLVALEIAAYRYDNRQQMQAAEPADKPEPAARPGLAGKKSGVEGGRPGGIGSADIIGRSAAMLRVFDLIGQVAPFDTSVLLLGESGTGKEDVARSIVEQSRRRTGPYIKINCAAIPSDLLESELFGYEKGAFTGATQRKPGKFELASGGTLLLDEIGEMPLDMQSRLLRVLQDKEVQRIGAATTIHTDVRIVAATGRNLEKEVAEGRFRLDLYYRLLVFPIYLPPLRTRKEDIPLLADHFLKFYAERTGKKTPAIHPQVLRQLQQYDWPGNVRQLQHVIERSVVLSVDGIIREIELRPITAAGAPEVEKSEKELILDVLRECQYRVSGVGGAAERLQMSASTLSYKMKKLGITSSYS